MEVFVLKVFKFIINENIVFVIAADYEDALNELAGNHLEEAMVELVAERDLPIPRKAA